MLGATRKTSARGMVARMVVGWWGRGGGSAPARSLGCDRDVAGECFSSDARRSVADLEDEAFCLRADAVLSRFERDREIALDRSAPRRDRELGAGCGRDGQPHVAGVRHELVAAIGADRVIVGKVCTARV